MAETQRITSYGRYPSCAHSSRLEDRMTRRIVNSADRTMRRSETIENFTCYDSSDDEENRLDDHGEQFLRTSFNFVDYFRSRETNTREIRKISREHGLRRVLSYDLLKEYSISLNKVNKVFCSQWLSDRQVVFGTKCNKLMVYDVTARNMIQIPLLHGQCTDHVDTRFGIYSVQINPSRTLLATRGSNSREIAIYRLPTLDPVCVGEQAHGDFVYDMCWLDDEFLVSGSQDSIIALWRIDCNLSEATKEATLPAHRLIQPISTKSEKSRQMVRSLIFNKEYKEIAVLSMDGFIHIWSAKSFKQKLSRKLPTNQSNKDVCLAVNNNGLYAVGCKSNTLLLDARTLHIVKKIPAKSGRGVRSVSFQDSILTMGTGHGALEFYDIKAQKSLENSANPNRNVRNAILKNSMGCMYPDQNLNVQSVEYTPAIFTHCYDASGIRLFSAGGPIEADLYGNYAGLWQ